MEVSRAETFLFMTERVNAFRIVNALSLDVAAGAVGSAAFLAAYWRIEVSLFAGISLFLATWTIYTVDHLVDASKLQAPSTFRHRLHKKYSRPLWVAVIIAAGCGLITLFFLEWNVIKGGVLLISLTAIYIALQSRLSFFKESFIALIYTAGVILPLDPGASLSHGNIMIIVVFFLTAYVNLITFSWFDYHNDTTDSQPSIAVALGRRTASSLTFVSFMALSAIAVYYGEREFFVLWTIALGHVSMLIWKHYFFEQERYRLFGDALFLIPGLYAIIVT